HLRMRLHQPDAAHGQAAQQRGEQHPLLDQRLAALAAAPEPAPAADHGAPPEVWLTNTAAPPFSPKACTPTDNRLPAFANAANDADPSCGRSVHPRAGSSRR